MSRRPLYGAAVLLLLLYLALPPSLWMHAGIREGTGVTFTGTIGRRELRENMQVFYLKDTSISGARWILVYLKDSEHQFFIGNTVNIHGTIKTFEKAGNPGQFDSLVYYQTQKIDAMCFADHMEVTGGEINRFQEGMLELRRKFAAALERTLGSYDGEILKAMLLGERKELPKEFETLLKQSGLSHLMAISGVHISILGAGVYKGLRRLGLPHGAAGIPALFLMGCYGVLIGAGVSALRALTMFFLLVGAEILGRTYDIRTALGTAAIGLLLEQPLYAQNGAFLLSFGAVFGLAEITPILMEIVEETEKKRREVSPKRKAKAVKEKALGKRILQPLKNGLCACLGIQMMTLPILFYFFYEVPVYSVFLNLLVIPLMGPLLTAGVFCMLLGMFVPGAAFLAAWICYGILRVLEKAAAISCSLPGAVFCRGCPGVWQIIVYYLLLALALVGMKRLSAIKNGKRKAVDILGLSGIRLPLCFGAYLIGFALLLWNPQPEFRLAMLDVGQGDAIFFQTKGGNTYLMDGGSTSEDQVGKYRVEPFFKYYGKKRVDYLFVSHLDQDHISGIEEILEEGLLEVGCLVLPGTREVHEAILSGESGSNIDREQMRYQTRNETKDKEKDEALRMLLKAAKKRGIPVRLMSAGDALKEGELYLLCLGPKENQEYENRNAGSMVLSLEYQKLKVLLTGDLEGSGERQVLENGFPCESYDILKVAHHGSRYTTGEEWLEKVRPKVSLISCGEDNSYGHPHPELLKRLKDAGSRIYLTPKGGAVLIESDGKKYSVKSWI